MSSIYTLVHETLAAGYLSIETESQLQKLSLTCSNLDDRNVLLLLKQAIAFGHVKRQASEMKRATPNHKKSRTTHCMGAVA